MPTPWSPDDVEPDHEDHLPLLVGDGCVPCTAEATHAAIEYMARITHLSDQSAEASRALGSLVGSFAAAITARGLSEGFAEELSQHYLELLLPPTRITE